MPDDYIKRSDALEAMMTCRSLTGVAKLEAVNHIMPIPAADVEPKQRWIPVTERLPDFTDRFIIILKRNDEYVPKDEEWDESYLRVTKFDVDTGNWCLSKRVKKCTEVTHWMPLPEPPKGEDDA